MPWNVPWRGPRHRPTQGLGQSILGRHLGSQSKPHSGVGRGQGRFLEPFSGTVSTAQSDAALNLGKFRHQNTSPVLISLWVVTVDCRLPDPDH